METSICTGRERDRERERERERERVKISRYQETYHVANGTDDISTLFISASIPPLSSLTLLACPSTSFFFSPLSPSLLSVWKEEKKRKNTKKGLKLVRGLSKAVLKEVVAWSGMLSISFARREKPKKKKKKTFACYARKVVDFVASFVARSFPPRCLLAR